MVGNEKYFILTEKNILRDNNFLFSSSHDCMLFDYLHTQMVQRNYFHFKDFFDSAFRVWYQQGDKNTRRTPRSGFSSPHFERSPVRWNSGTRSPVTNICCIKQCIGLRLFQNKFLIEQRPCGTENCMSRTLCYSVLLKSIRRGKSMDNNPCFQKKSEFLFNHSPSLPNCKYWSFDPFCRRTIAKTSQERLKTTDMLLIGYTVVHPVK